MTMEERMIARIEQNGQTITTQQAKEYIRTISDRICLRIAKTELPGLMESICVDAAVKLYRRMYYEGIHSETEGGISTTFIADVLAEYDPEFEIYRNQGNGDEGGRYCVFLP